ncbi:MAG TPA: ABC transporter ATP-binding protein [Polyangiales bacterium]|nr:ABC transporter ATP-binding protein [Polyangiales bacterium]
MARIELHGLAHHYAAANNNGTDPALRGGSDTPEQEFALKPLDLTWDDGGAYALLGPSGCGKTTLLNLISGLLRPSRGSILLDGRDVTALSPRERNIAQVFQFPVVYDTMTVYENLAFPLRNRAVGRREAHKRVTRIAELLELRDALGLRASGLSADLKQRIALGRGLVREDVAAILLDEPLTVVDPHEKWRLRRKLLQIHTELRVTLIYVTHDQVEALTLADEVVVMNEGQVLQLGTPQQLFERPEHIFVGHFIGSPGMNLLACTVEDGCALVEGHRIRLRPETIARVPAGQLDLVLGVRPEFLRLHARATAAPEGSIEVAITRIDELGGFRVAHARLGCTQVAVKVPEDHLLNSSEPQWIEFPPERLILYASEHAICE